MTIECYVQNSQGFNVNSGYSPCGNLNTTTPSLSCCGGIDICMSGGFCFHTYSSPGETGYYIPGCTTENKDDPACIARCRKLDARTVKAENGLIVIIFA